MYLFLVDYNYISSEQLQRMIGQILPDTDIVNCFSAKTLVKISEKLAPDIIIIDFDLVEDNHVDLIETVRNKSSNAHILSLIDPEYYEKLYKTIELGLIDDYMVKPVSQEEFMARLLITTKRYKLFSKVEESVPEFDDHKTTIYGVFDDVEQKQVSEKEKYAFSDSEILFDEELLKDENTGEEKSFFTDQVDQEGDSTFTSSDQFDSFEETVLPDQVDEDLFEKPLAAEITEKPEKYTGEKDDPLDFQDLDSSFGDLSLNDSDKPADDHYFDKLFEDDSDQADLNESLNRSEKLSATNSDDLSDLDFSGDEHKPIAEKPTRNIKDFLPGESADEFLSSSDFDSEETFSSNDFLEEFILDEMDEPEEYFRTDRKKKE